MSALLALLLRRWRIALAGVAVLALVGGALWLVHYGRVIERGAQAAASLSNLRDRSAIDDGLRSTTDQALCRALGGGDECRGLPDQR